MLKYIIRSFFALLREKTSGLRRETMNRETQHRLKNSNFPRYLTRVFPENIFQIFSASRGR